MRFPNDWLDALTIRMGRAAILFAQIEYLLKLYAKQFLGGFDRGMIVTSRMQFNQLLDITSALVEREIANPDLKQRFLALLPGIQKVQEKRNRYFHAAWGVGADGGPMTIGFTRAGSSGKKGNGGLVKKMVAVNAADLDELIQSLESIKATLTDLRPRIWPSLGKRRRKATF